MVVDAIRAYFEAASGLTELTRRRAVAAAKVLLREGDGRAPGRRDEDGGEPAEEGAAQRSRVGPSIQALAAELVETSEANRAALAEVVAAEVRRSLERLDVVSRTEYERVVRRVAELERRVAAQAEAQRALRLEERRLPTRGGEEPSPGGPDVSGAAAAEEAQTPPEGGPGPAASANGRETEKPAPAASEPPERDPEGQEGAQRSAAKSGSGRSAKGKSKQSSRSRSAKGGGKRAAKAPDAGGQESGAV